MDIQAVIWDLGGVLVRTEDRSRRLHWEQKLGLDPGRLDKLVFEGELGKAAAFGKAQAADIWQALALQFNLSYAERTELEGDFWAGDCVDQGLISLTRTFQSKIATGLLSNAWPDLRHALETLWAIADAFDEIVISAEVGLAKPDPRIYQLILGRFGLNPVQAVFIDDFVENIEAAKQVGMHAIHFTTSAEVQEKLSHLIGAF